MYRYWYSLISIAWLCFTPTLFSYQEVLLGHHVGLNAGVSRFSKFWGQEKIFIHFLCNPFQDIGSTYFIHMGVQNLKKIISAEGVLGLGFGGALKYYQCHRFHPITLKQTYFQRYFLKGELFFVIKTLRSDVLHHLSIPIYSPLLALEASYCEKSLTNEKAKVFSRTLTNFGKQQYAFLEEGTIEYRVTYGYFFNERLNAYLTGYIVFDLDNLWEGWVGGFCYHLTPFISIEGAGNVDGLRDLIVILQMRISTQPFQRNIMTRSDRHYSVPHLFENKWLKQRPFIPKANASDRYFRPSQRASHGSQSYPNDRDYPQFQRKTGPKTKASSHHSDKNYYTNNDVPTAPIDKVLKARNILSEKYGISGLDNMTEAEIGRLRRKSMLKLHVDSPSKIKRTDKELHQMSAHVNELFDIILDGMQK